MERKGIHAKLSEIQRTLKAPKDLYNLFGKYNYRSSESILEALKPLLAKEGVSITLSDELVLIGDRFYVASTATLTDVETEASVSCRGFAREDRDKKGMDGSQLTGATASYARKYALCGLFAIDDNKDADSPEYQKVQQEASRTEAESKAKERREAAPGRRKELKGIISKGDAEKWSAWLSKRYGTDDVEALSDVQLEDVSIQIETQKKAKARKVSGGDAFKDAALKQADGGPH